MKIGINFDSSEHCKLFIKFLIKYGYKTTFLYICSKSIRIDTTKRQIIGWAISRYIKNGSDVDEAINWNDNIGFNFSDYEISRDFIQLLLSIGIKNTNLYELAYQNIRIQNCKLESSTRGNYVNNYLCTYAIDLNLKKEQKGKNIMPTKEQILSAAAKCPQAEEVLKELFPDVFPVDKSVKIDKPESEYMCIRYGGPFNYKGFYLTDRYNWSIENDDGSQVLVPWRKS